MSATAAFAMILMGCADDGSACQRLAAPVQPYPTQGQCIKHIETALNGDVAMSADYPTITARCVPAPKFASKRAATPAAQRAR